MWAFTAHLIASSMITKIIICECKSLKPDNDLKTVFPAKVRMQWAQKLFNEKYNYFTNICVPN